MHIFKRQNSASQRNKGAEGNGTNCTPGTPQANAEATLGTGGLTPEEPSKASPVRGFPPTPPLQTSPHKASPMPLKPAPAATALRPMQMKVRLSFRTDIGGMHENQDDCFVWRHPGSSSLVIGVLDGHGRDVGQLASACVKEFMVQWLDRRWGELLADPAEAFRAMFSEAHASMLQSFREHLTAQGWAVKEQSGYLMKRRNLAQPWTCVHGGTSGSVVAIVEGRKMLIANVGDSACLLAAQGREVRPEDLVQHSFWEDGGGVMEMCTDHGTVGHVPPNDAASAGAAAGGGGSGSGSGGGGGGGGSSLENCVQTLVLTADHSPESRREFCRMRLTHPSPNNPRLPNLLVVYDSPTPNKLKCSPVFDLDEATGAPRVTGKGRYYKNVRREWASLVATPPRARFQDALAFTRSIGDYHLQTYGVTHVPDVMSFDLSEIYHRPQKNAFLLSSSRKANAAAAAAGSGGGGAGEAGGALSQQQQQQGVEMIACLVCASDGIWDNWQWGEVSRFFLAPHRVEQVRQTNSSESAMEEFMQENDRRAKANFGDQADNATAVCCYLFMAAAEA